MRKKNSNIPMPKSLVALSLLACQQGVNAATPEEVASWFRGTQYYNEQCLVSSVSQESNNTASECDYLIVDQSHLGKRQRLVQSGKLLGLRFDTPYLIITGIGNNKAVYPLNEWQPELVDRKVTNYRDQKKPLQSFSRQANSERGVYEILVAREIPLGRDKIVIPPPPTPIPQGKAELIYKVRLYSQNPYYETTGDRSKYADVILENGTGINFIENDDNSFVYRSFGGDPKRTQSYNFIYKQYLDEVQSTIRSLSDNVVAERVIPDQQMQTTTNITKEDSKSINVGFSRIPKLPIESLGLAVKSFTKVESATTYQLSVSKGTRDAQIRYVNDFYGSKDNKYCNLNTADGWCWDYYPQSYAPYDIRKIRTNIPSSLAGMKPDFKVIFRAPANMATASKIEVLTNVVGLELLAHNRFYSGQRWAAGDKLWDDYYSKASDPEWVTGKTYLRKDHRDRFELDIDWSSPVFLGVSPVAIQSTFLSGSEARCLTKSNVDNTLLFETCRNGEKRQAFVFDQRNRYRSVADLSLCLDVTSERLSLSANCANDYAPSGQRWQWQQPQIFSDDVVYSSDSQGGAYALSVSEHSDTPAVIRLENGQTIPARAKFTTQHANW